MSRLKKEEKAAMFRLSLILQSLHDEAVDETKTEEQRIAAAHELGQTLNRHFDKIVSALREAGGITTH